MMRRISILSLVFASTLLAEPITNSIGMKLVPVSPGDFTMGQDGPPSDYRMSKHPEKFDDADWDEKPAHQVTITRQFHIGSTEVTLGQYRQFKPEYRKDKGADDDAVSGVSWNDAVAYCEWLSKKEDKPYRLPTEAEWEYACRAGTTTLFHTGDTLPAEFRILSGKAETLRVAQTPANAWGLFDMHGNVAEWCSDWYGPYETAVQTDPSGRSEGDFRVFRGGNYALHKRLLRSANRSAWIPESVSSMIGFRVVLGERSDTPPVAPPAPPLHAQNIDQTPATVSPRAANLPFFQGPKPFVKIPPDSVGPMFSWHNHSPSITECPNGDLLAVWYSCADENGSELTNLASRLRRGATEWEPASPFWDGVDVNDHAPKIWWDGDKTLYHFAKGNTENIMRTSTDNGATWSKAQVIPPAGEFGNQLLLLRDGTLVLGHDSRQVSLVISRDAGKTWIFNDVQQRSSDFRPGGQGFRYPGIHAPIVQLTDGRIMALSRNDKPEDQAKFNFKTPASFSSDLGKTWTYEATEFPAISFVQRAAMIRLQEGPILLCSFTDPLSRGKDRQGMTFSDATGKTFTGYGMFAALSFDDGKTWPVRRLVTPGGKEQTVSTIDRTQFLLSDTTAEPQGYLAATQTRDGNVQLITSKNHYVFNLAWLKEKPAPVVTKTPPSK